ncbi:MAG: hypothetical protein PHE43_00720 [Candidatus Nanoarchaeia archaeon]|nr:hypothetical protein [Candidatus Nanoarchaeia archaeon]
MKNLTNYWSFIMGLFLFIFHKGDFYYNKLEKKMKENNRPYTPEEDGGGI